MTIDAAEQSENILDLSLEEENTHDNEQTGLDET